MEIIISLKNPLIKKVQDLREARERKVQGMTIIDGAREIKRAFESGIVFEQVYYVKGHFDALLRQLDAKGIKIVEVTDKIMEKIVYGERHDGLVAIVRTPNLALRELKLSTKPLIVVLDALEKPGNLGAVLRTCDGVGVEAVLVSDAKTDIYNPNVIRSSTGMIFSVPVVSASATEISNFLRSKNIKICAAAPAASKAYTELNFKSAWALVLGSEDKGLSDMWLSQSDSTIKIPMKGRADSLNVSISAAIILYEALRQRQS